MVDSTLAVVLFQIHKMFPKSDLVDNPIWNENECVKVISTFYSTYYKYEGFMPEHLTNQTILKCLNALPIDQNGIDYEPEYYLSEYSDYGTKENGLIDQYMQTDFYGNYSHSLPHFLSGDVRFMRMMELGLCGAYDKE